MSIDDCITEYETLGPKIFAHPRWLHLRSPLFWPRDKYDHRSLEKVIRNVVDRRSPFVGGKNFASDENRCRTYGIIYPINSIQAFANSIAKGSCSLIENRNPPAWKHRISFGPTTTCTEMLTPQSDFSIEIPASRTIIEYGR